MPNFSVENSGIMNIFSRDLAFLGCEVLSLGFFGWFGAVCLFCCCCLGGVVCGFFCVCLVLFSPLICFCSAKTFVSCQTKLVRERPSCLETL